jgi:hypothetical protein
MALLTFAQAQTLFAPYVTSQGASDPVVASAINFVNERLISSGQWRGNRFAYNFTVSQDSAGNYYFDTVPGIEAVLRVIALDTTYMTGEIADVMSDWYPWNENGIGYMSPTYVGDTQILRLGNSPAFPLPSGDGSGHYTSDTQRYRVIGKIPETRTMMCLVRRGYVPLVNPEDVLVPSNRNAYRYGCQAYVYENNNELERAQVYWDLAYKSLNDESIAFEEGSSEQVEIQMKAFAPGIIQNLI